MLFVGRACTADGWPSRVVTSDTLEMLAHGTVEITTKPSFKDVCTGTLRHFVPADCSLVASFSSEVVERVRSLSHVGMEQENHSVAVYSKLYLGCGQKSNPLSYFTNFKAST